MLSMIKIYCDGTNTLTINTHYLGVKSVILRIIDDINKHESQASVYGNVLIVSTNEKYNSSIKEKINNIFKKQ